MPTNNTTDYITINNIDDYYNIFNRTNINWDDYLSKMQDSITSVSSDNSTSETQKIQEQISLLNQRIVALEELLLEFGIKKVFDKAGDEAND